MRARISIIFFSVALLVAIATLAAYMMVLYPTLVKFAVFNRETINVAPYIYGKTPPVSLGVIKNPGAYVHLKLRFRADSIEGYPNVFQTAPLNHGMRMEISGSTAGIVVPNLAVPDGLERITLTTVLKTGQWYALEVEALNGTFVRVMLDGLLVKNYYGASLSMETSQLLVGDSLGFDPPRPFRGQIENISVTKGNIPQSWGLFLLSIANNSGILIFSFVCIFIVVMVKRVSGGTIDLVLLQKRIRDSFSKQVVQFPQLYLELRNCELSRDLKLKYLVTIITVGFVAITIFYYYRSMVLEMGYPKNTFLPVPSATFTDFVGVIEQWSLYKFSGVGYGLSYFPSTYLIADIFSHIHPMMFSLTTFLTIFCCFFFVYTYRNLRSRNNLIETIQNVVVCVFMTYPVLFTIHTANFEAFVFMFLCLFVYLYQRGKLALSILPLAMCISMKLFPAVFLILFVADKKYKELFLTLIAIVFLSLLPLLIFDGGMSSGLDVYFGNLKASQKMYFDLMVMGSGGNNFGHSLLNGLRIVMGDAFPPMQKILLPYLALSTVIFSMVSLFIIFVERVFWKRIALLVISMCLLPYTSTDYKLLHFFIPLFLFINYGKTEAKESEPYDLFYILLFSLLLIPKNYYYFHDNPLYTLNNVLNPILMIALLLLIVRSRIQQVRATLRTLKKMAFIRTGDRHHRETATENFSLFKSEDSSDE